MFAHALKREDIVKNRYANQNVVESYSTVGLFPAEKKIFLQYFCPNSSILDLGCGAGRTSIPLAQYGYKVIGIDFAPAMIEAAKRQAKLLDLDLPFYTQDATKMTFAPESFDNVLFSYNGLEQIPGPKNRDKVLRDVYRILKPGGCFIFTTRSGLAFGGRRSLAWVLMSLDFIHKRFIKGLKDWELGDKAWGGNYFSYSNPFKIRAKAQAAGFQHRDFNSENNINCGKKATFLTSFSNDRMLFYVLKKQAK
jgi:SAM-dependent methyltransferase